MTEYDVQAADFLKKANAALTFSRIGEVQGFPGETFPELWRYKYQVVLTRNGKQARFTFYDSHNNWKEHKRPSKYSFLASCEKYPVEDTLEGFAAEYGYDLTTREGRKTAKKIWEACAKEYAKLLDLFGPELMKDLREIW